MSSSSTSLSVLHSLDLSESLSALEHLSSLLTCSCCHGPPGDRPALLDGCGHSICNVCCAKDQDDQDDEEANDDQEEEEEEEERLQGWPGGSCPVAACGVYTNRNKASLDRVRLERAAAVTKMQVAINGDSAQVDGMVRETFTSASSSPQKVRPAKRSQAHSTPNRSAANAKVSKSGGAIAEARSRRKEGGKFFKAGGRRSSSPTESMASSVSSVSSKRSKGATKKEQQASSKSIVQKLVMSKMKKGERTETPKELKPSSLDRKNTKGETKLQRACIKVVST